ncbi:serine/threonine-protein kinase [Streptomyces sp. NPDC005805]|uniref:serine/threonine-protein kinase n=1 Tax=Streptomyces sp. NPDC005805 TaxID=3157068 RepID=UPI0033FFE38C
MSEAPGSGRMIAERYRLIGPLGEGGTGVAWLARDELLDRDVAVKEIRVPAGPDAAATRAHYARLEDAARRAGRVAHRNVVAVHDVAAGEGRPWIVMELVRGLALSEVLEAEGALPPRRAAQIGAEALAGLRAAHAAGVVHGDVRPSKVLIANDGRVLVTGFGAADPGGGPEAVANGAAADLWSLGALLHTAVTGRAPDGGAGVPERAEALGPVIEGLLRPDPADRIPAADAEHRLRLAAAGGGRHEPGPGADGPASPAPLPPRTESEATGGGPGGRADGDGDGSPAPDPVGSGDDEQRTGAGPAGRLSPVAVLALGVVALLAAVAALVWTVTGG